MALGYAMARGDVGVYSVVPGPGFLNASAALATAYGLNAQVLCLVGQIPTRAMASWSGSLSGPTASKARQKRPAK